MVLKQPDINLANQLLADWWLNNSKVTTLEFKQELRDEYPEHNWTQQWVSWFLFNTNHPFEDNGAFKTYYRDNSTLFGTITLSSSFPLSQALPQVVSVELTLDVINKLVEDYHGVRLNKEQIKKYLKERSVQDFDDFEELFQDSNWAFTGKYTSDNKKIYVAIKPDEYFSQSRQVIIPIASLPKPHIKNTLKKRYGNVTIEHLLDNQGEECFRLFKQYCK